MPGKWKRVDNRDAQGKVISVLPEEEVYNIMEERIVRSVQRKNLILDRERLMNQVYDIDADLDMIEKLQAAESVERGRK